MKLIQAFIIAISMYSKIPMPRVEWTEESMRYAFCFFPVVGGIIGILQVLAGGVLLTKGNSILFFSCIMTLIPIWITGGIHLDGFVDTVDAISSYGEKEKRLEILKDPHIGAFAAIGLGSLLILQLGCWSLVEKPMLPVIGFGYVLSRALSALSVMLFPPAKKEGLARTFRDNADAGKKRTIGVLVLWTIAGVAGMWNTGGSAGILAATTAFAIWGYYKWFSQRTFGGVSGDQAGYFLVLCETGILIGTILGFWIV